MGVRLPALVPDRLAAPPPIQPLARPQPSSATVVLPRRQALPRTGKGSAVESAPKDRAAQLPDPARAPLPPHRDSSKSMRCSAHRLILAVLGVVAMGTKYSRVVDIHDLDESTRKYARRYTLRGYQSHELLSAAWTQCFRFSHNRRTSSMPNKQSVGFAYGGVHTTSRVWCTVKVFLCPQSFAPSSPFTVDRCENHVAHTRSSLDVDQSTHLRRILRSTDSSTHTP